MKSRHGQAEAGASGRAAPAHAGVATLPKLTSLRFFAAFWVLGFHALPRTAPPNAWAAFWNLGWLGVTFFFVLSGFILTYTYGRDGGKVDRRRFWFARFARVYPLYLFALAFAVPRLVHDLRDAGSATGAIGGARLAGAIFSSLTMMQSWFSSYVCVWNCPSWSLSDEALFYALFPFAVLLAATRNRRAVLLALTLGGMALVAWGSSSAAPPEVSKVLADASLNPLLRLPEFLVGVWLGGVFLARRPVLSIASIVVTLTTLVLIAYACWAGLHPLPVPPQLMAAPLFAILIYAVAGSRDPNGGLLTAAPLVLLGEASYALYMLHGPLHGYVLAMFNRVAPSTPDGVRFSVYVIAALILAIASYTWLERPARAWLRARFDRSLATANGP